MPKSKRKISRRRFFKWAAGLGAFGLVASYPVFIERYIVLINTYRICVPNLPEAFRGFRVVQLTDLHYGSLVPLSLIRSVVARANRLQRDITICTGDYIHERKAHAQIDTVWPVLDTLTAPAGVFNVLGNHDYWADGPRSKHWLAKTSQDLNHKTHAIQKSGSRLWLIGAGDLWEDHVPLDTLLQNVPDSDCRIVLAHNPDTADTPFSSRVDLMISGHTHGGQVRIPFVGTPVLPVENKTYNNGLKTSPRGLNVFISRGIGWSILPVRFNCFPEIAVLELVPLESKDTR